MTARYIRTRSQDGSGDQSKDDYVIQDLIDSEVTLTHWTRPDGTGLEETSLRVDSAEVCVSTPTGGSGLSTVLTHD
jgi:hypothetical protein